MLWNRLEVKEILKSSGWSSLFRLVRLFKFVETYNFSVSVRNRSNHAHHAFTSDLEIL